MLMICLVLFMMSGMVLNTTLYEGVRNYLILFPTVMIFLIILKKNRFKFNLFFTKLDNIYYLFIFFCLLSSFYNGEIFRVNTTIQYFIYYFILVICLRNLTDYSIYISSFFIAEIILLFVNIFNSPIVIGITNYQGIYENPNNFGIFSATLFIMSIGMYVIRINKNKNNKLNLFYVLLMLFSFYLITISANRTAFLGVILSLLMLVFCLFISFVKQNRMTIETVKKIIIGFVVMVTFIFIIFETPIYSAIESNIISKFIDRGSNITSNRTDIWQAYLNNSQLFRTKGGYLESFIGLSAHNSYIEIIGQFGKLSGFYYVTFWILSFIKTIIYCINNVMEDKYSILALLSVSLFIIMSMMETLVNAPIMYLALTSIGYISAMESKEKMKTEKIKHYQQTVKLNEII